MDAIFRFTAALKRDPAVDAWLDSKPDELRVIARQWFAQMRQCGADVRELIHDGCPVACVNDAAFGYVNAFTSHVNVGFFNGAALNDSAGLLEGTGKRMRHVKVRPGCALDSSALTDLIHEAYLNMKSHARPR
jgi:hypothetical protein